MQQYEEIRRHCLQVRGLHPDDKSVCHQSLLRVENIPDVLVYKAFLLLDDMAICLSKNKEKTQ